MVTSRLPRRAIVLAVFVLCLATTRAASHGEQTGFPGAADIETYRGTVEKVFLTDRGGTIPGMAACVMCHTWQTSLRFDLETPATDAGWAPEQSRLNFQMITKLVNTAVRRPARCSSSRSHQEREVRDIRVERTGNLAKTPNTRPC